MLERLGRRRARRWSSERGRGRRGSIAFQSWASERPARPRPSSCVGRGSRRRRRAPTSRRRGPAIAVAVAGARGERHRRRQVGELGRARLRSTDGSSPARRGRAAPRLLAERLLEPPQRIAQLELAEGLAQPRAVGRRAARSRSTSMPASMSRLSVASSFEMRACSACSRRFSWRFAPEISSMCASTPSSDPYCWSSCGGRLVADAGNAGDVVRGVALQPDEVGDQLRRDAVALDHALAVVDARVGDPAGRGHHPHPPVVGQLVGVAVAGHDHHVDARLACACSARLAITSSAS